jgi:hypothetical protein
MTSIALITEGITDQAFLESVLDGVTLGRATIRPLRPLRDATDQSRVAENEFSNWELVFEYLRSEKILDAIQTSDYIVVHIDSDQCDHQNFGVPLLENGTTKSISRLVDDVRAKLIAALHPKFPKTEIGRLLFALPVLSTECWLLAHVAGTNHTEKSINNCGHRAKLALAVKKVKYVKDYDHYMRFTKGLRKAKNLEALERLAPCLRLFTNSARAILIQT